jgi:hypothetical protein
MGSLFKARESWSNKLDDDIGFHTGCLEVSNVDNAPDGLGESKQLLKLF